MEQAALSAPDDMARELRDWLKGHLPGYMVPSHIRVQDKFILNTSGKIDRKALILPGELPAETVPEGVSGSSLEQQMVAIWQDLLSLGNINVQESFFDLGGHSLLMTQLKSRLDEVLDQPITLVELFQYPTIRGLLDYLEPEEEATKPAIVDEPRRQAQETIAVIGMAGRFPGAADVDEFWANIRDGVESIHEYSDEETQGDAGPGH